MAQVNQRGEPIAEEMLFYDSSEMSNADLSDAIALLCGHLGVEIWATNATKHGDRQLVLRKS